MRSVSRHTDAVLAVGVIGLVLLLVVPLPPLLLDTLLCFSIVLSIMSLLLAVYIENALEFSSFPSLLLFLTLFRLGLNISSTRMILSRAEGGDIIQTFGEFVTGNHLGIGLILFALLTMINFMVVTKGAGRIAEVAARFTLEALPGKQMAVDSDLSAGLITKAEAKQMRSEISQESEFYGAMDGASKFVRGDAIAGLIITSVNIVGGLIIGMVVKQMSFWECLTTFTQLTVGDGLVSQIPALFISIGAGIMVTRASKGSLGEMLSKQIFHHPKVLMIAGLTLLALSLVPGMPLLVMLPMAALLLGMGFFQRQQKQEPEEIAPHETSFFVYPLEVELGYQILLLAEPLQAKLKEIRHQVAHQIGFRLPSVHITDSRELSGSGWRIKVKGVVSAQGREGELLPITLKLKEVISSHAHELLSRLDVSVMIQQAKEIDPLLVEELIPKKLKLGSLSKILQNLLKERVPIRDFVTILEILDDHAGDERDVSVLTEHVRGGLSRGISELFFGRSQIAHVITLDPKVEQMLDVGKGKLRPSIVDKLARALIAANENASSQGFKPVVVTQVSSRALLRKVIEKQLPDLPVLSYKEVAPEIELEPVENISTEVLIA